MAIDDMTYKKKCKECLERFKSGDVAICDEGKCGEGMSSMAIRTAKNIEAGLKNKNNLTNE